MKKFKKVLALALAFAMVAALMPVMGKAVKAADAGFYVWYPDTEGGTFDESVLTWKAVGTPSTRCENFISVFNTSSDPKKTLGFALSTEYTTGGTNGWGTYDGATCSKAGLKVGSNCKVDIKPNCDGTIKIYWAPKVKNVVDGKTDSIKFDGSTYEYVLSGTRPVDAASAKIDMQVIEKDVVSGKTYVLSRGGNEARLCMITFTPAPEEPEVPLVSSKDKSYRSASLEDKYGNAVRFRSELNKSSSNFDSIKEYGTLVAIQDTVGAEAVLEVEDGKSSKVKSSKTFYEGDDVRQYTLVVTNIPDEKKNSVIVARPYVILKDGTVHYGEQISGSWEGIKEIVDRNNLERN